MRPVADRPSFRRRQAPPEARGRIAAMALLLVLCAGLLGVRKLLLDRQPQPVPQVVVEVRGDVPQPGYHAVPAPARVHDAIVAAGGDAAGFVDGGLEPGTRLVVEHGSWRAEAMDELLVVGLPIDVNRASAAALQAVPGLGETRSAAIVAEREANGAFDSVDDLTRVHGIGPATVEKLRPFVTAE